MFELERNSLVEPTHLAEFLGRCGWQDPQAATKLGWVLADSDEWVVCRLDGEVIGFGRSTRSSRFRHRLVSVLVDPRYEQTGLSAAIVRLLAEGWEGTAAVSAAGVPAAPDDAYLGRPSLSQPRLSQ
jgi:hypothetical protein